MIKSKPTISIIIPAYNVEKFLESALNSIKFQKELPDEIILIDDGSVDATLKIAMDYDFSVPYTVLSVQNSGQGNARNLGLKYAVSDYVYFFDSDDLLTDNFIESIKIKIKQNQYPDILLFSGKSFNDREYKGSRVVDYSRGFSGFFYDRLKFLETAVYRKKFICSPCLYISKRKIWREQELSFGKNYYEDEAIFYPLLFSCDNYLVIDEVFFLRRNREGSTMTMLLNEKHVNGMLDCMHKSLQLYSKPDISVKERWFVSKRLEDQCVAYILRARRANLKYSYFELLLASIKSKNPLIIIKSTLYVLNVNNISFVRYVVRIIRKKLFSL